MLSHTISQEKTTKENVFHNGIYSQCQLLLNYAILRNISSPTAVSVIDATA